MTRRVHFPLFPFFVVLAVIIAGNVILRYFGLPNTSIGGIQIAGKTRSEAKNELLSKKYQTINLEIQNRSYSMDLSQLGIEVDADKTVSDAFSANSSVFPIIHLIPRLFSHRDIKPVFRFTPAYDTFVSTMPESFGTEDDPIVLDNDAKIVVSLSDEPSLKIDDRDLAYKITASFGKPDTVIRPKITPIFTDRDARIAEINSALASTFNTPLPVDIIGLEQLRHILVTFSPDELKQVVTIPQTSTMQSLTFVPNDQQMARVISEKVRSVTSIPIPDGAIAKIGQEITTSLKSRFAGVDPGLITLALGDVPKTDGKKANKYIEVDIGQQRMYLFSDGNIRASYPVSTGLDFPTPPGQYQILNKAPNAFSKIYNVFMPYWMAFYFHPKLGASLGIHELPYWIDSTGKKIQRPRNFIGSPHTGGCIALDVGVAKEVYAFADVGTPLYIFQ